MQREIRKRKANAISRSAAEVHSFACVEDLSERAGDRLLTFTTNVSCIDLRKTSILLKFCVNYDSLCKIKLHMTLNLPAYRVSYVAEELRSIVDCIQNIS